MKLLGAYAITWFDCRFCRKKSSAINVCNTEVIIFVMDTDCVYKLSVGYVFEVKKKLNVNLLGGNKEVVL